MPAKSAVNFTFKHLTSSLLLAIFAAFVFLIAPVRAQETIAVHDPVIAVPPAAETASTVEAASLPKTRESQRLELYLDEVKTLELPGKIETVAVLAPVVVEVVVAGENSVRISCITLGETTVILSGGGQRTTLVVSLVSHPIDPQSAYNSASARGAAPAFGSYTVGFSPASGGYPALFRHNLTLQKQISPTRTLRADLDFYHPLGRRNAASYSPLDPRYTLNRIELGVTGEDYRLDFLDSSVNLSRADLDNYQLRGPHFQKLTPSAFGKTRASLELFGGLARPTGRFFDRRTGGLAGGNIAVINTPKFMLRAGLVSVFDKKGNAEAVHLDARYEQSDRDQYQFAVDYDLHNLSFYGRTENKVRDFTINTEVTHVAATSPFLRIGAQGAGRTSFNGTVYWQPKSPFSAFVIVERTSASAFAFSRSSSYDLNLLLSSFNYSPNSRTRFSFGYADQSFSLERGTGLPDTTVNTTKTRGLTFTYSQLFGRGWSNELSLRPTFTRDPRMGTKVANDLTIREELRRSWERWSLSGFVNLNRRRNSLESLISGNPELLPEAYRAEYERDPVLFFLNYRERLPSLTGITAPFLAAGNFETGLKTQGYFTKSTYLADVRYLSGEFFGRRQKSILISGSYNYELDQANLIGINASQLISATPGTRGSSIYTLTYTHRFGTGSSGTINPLKFLGLDKLFGGASGRIEGRIFADSNNNSLDDEKTPGIEGVTVTLDRGRDSTVTDAGGNYFFKNVSKGIHTVGVKIARLGVAMRATTPDQQSVYVEKGKPATVNFGLNNKGFVSGRVINDLLAGGDGSTAPGLPGVRITLMALDQTGAAPQTRITNLGGNFDFFSLEPGRYRVEIDPATLPPNYGLPAQTVWEITVEPLKANYLKIPVIAQRALAGVVYIDVDGDELYNPEKDEPLAGARITARLKNAPENAAPIEILSGEKGTYFLRRLPAGEVELEVTTADGRPSPVKLSLTIAPDPETRRNFNLPFTPRSQAAANQSPEQ